MDLKYPTTSKTLLDKIVSGDGISWNEFYQRYSGIIQNIAQYKGLQEDDSKDILQDVMLEFFKQSKTFHFDPQKARFRTYLWQIINAKISDFYRKKYRDSKLAEDVKPLCESETEDEYFMTEWRKTVIDDAYAKLKTRITPDTWQAFEMYALQSRPVSKVASYLGCSENQIYQAKKRCIAALKEIIEEMNKQDPDLKLEILNNGI